MQADERRARDLVRERSSGICERCSAARAQHWHHRLDRSLGGKWHPANGLHTCPPCHLDVTSPFGERRALCLRNGWVLETHQDPLKVPVLMRHGYVFDWFFLLDDGSLVPTSPPDSTEEAA